MTPEQHEQELRQLRELRSVCDGKCEDPDDQPQDNHQDNHIGATNEEVRKLLRRCGWKLGIDYRNRED